MKHGLDAVVVYCLQPHERPNGLPAIIDQVWQCSHAGTLIGFLYTTVYGWTNSYEVSKPDQQEPKEWSHWQSQDVALDRLLDELYESGRLPRVLELQHLQFLLGDEFQESCQQEPVEGFDFLDPYLSSLSPAEQIEVLQEALFRCAIELELAQGYQPEQPTGIAERMVWFLKQAIDHH
ncbi:hypothetical protein IFO70_35135 [Phormidium tenue FACHB-886]|nr:hypothetical protein [Phormidium tenue FACHB-886]